MAAILKKKKERKNTRDRGREKKREGRQTEMTQRKTENRECVCIMCTCVLGHTSRESQTGLNKKEGIQIEANAIARKKYRD